MTFLVVAALVWWDLRQTSPGDLSSTHSAVEELTGRNACAACHGGAGITIAEACGECHAATLEDIETEHGLHGTLAQAVGGAHAAVVAASACNHCHREHNGAELELVSEGSFKLAGFGSRSSFDHERLGYMPEGAHQDLACVDCHTNADAVRIAKGVSRFGGLTQACATCHEDPHEGQIERACADCHGQQRAFDELAAFQHDARFELTGAHGLAAIVEARGADESQRCTTCHEPKTAHSVEALADLGDELTVRSCADCHTSPHSEPFLAEATGETCSSCHTSLPGGFGHELSQLGTEGRELELHAAAGFALDAPHDKAACADCHGPLTPPPSVGIARAMLARSADTPLFPGRAADDCAACHVDPHAGANGASCLDCHQAAGPWDDLSSFGHEAFALRGVHAATACTECHGESGPSATSLLSSRRDRGLENPPRSCTDCHDDPHTAEFLGGVIALVPSATTSDETCATCHALEPLASNRDFGFHVTEACFPVDLHAASGFPLTDPHNEVACAGCHGEPTQKAPADLLRTASTQPEWSSLRALPFAQKFPAKQAPRDPQDCATCHASPHTNDFVASQLAESPNDCRACHGSHRFTPSMVDPELHASTRFPLDGAHQAVGCFACHATEPGALCPNFDSAPSDCASCHTNVHQGARLSDVTALSAPAAALFGEGQGCARCHTPDDFHTVAAPAARSANHATLFGFELEGAHAAADCTTCHRKESAKSPDARSFGRIAVVFPGKLGACSTCHSDVHAGAFDGPGKPQAIEGRSDCARCHEQTSFVIDTAQTAFDHALWADFPLEGVHAETACGACHDQTPYTNSRSRLPQTRGTSCADCHADIHLGQFKSDMTFSTDCSRCHDAAEPDFAATRFDHASDSRFALDESHAELECAACHRAWPLEGGGEVVRYKPLGTTCADCHGVVPQ